MYRYQHSPGFTHISPVSYSPSSRPAFEAARRRRRRRRSAQQRFLVSWRPCRCAYIQERARIRPPRQYAFDTHRAQRDCWPPIIGEGGGKKKKTFRIISRYARTHTEDGCGFWRENHAPDRSPNFLSLSLVSVFFFFFWIRLSSTRNIRVKFEFYLYEYYIYEYLNKIHVVVNILIWIILNTRETTNTCVRYIN